jgi:signal-transduction protein with cAMP-binding, CBS, and nucleotidyltransferase domain
MSDGKFRHIPVVEDGELVGVVSIRDLVSADMHIHSADAHHGSDFP